MPPLARKQSSESIGRKAPSRTIEDAESITSWGPDGSHELEFDELSAHSGPGSEYALSRPSSEAVLAVPLTRKDGGGLGRQAMNRHALRGGSSAEQTTSSLLRGLDLDESKSVAEQLRDALSSHAVRVIDLFREWDSDGSRRQLCAKRSRWPCRGDWRRGPSSCDVPRRR